MEADVTADEFASRARTSVDLARVGALTTYARHPGSQTTTTVDVQARDDGTVQVSLARGALASQQLLARPIASLRVAPVGCEPVLLHGVVRRLPGHGSAGRLVFHLAAASVRVGSPPVLLDEPAYSAAEPDPLRHEACAVLRHLNEAHGAALGACLRVGGHEAAFVHATRLDRTGLTVLTVTESGVRTVHLRFPTPIRRLDDLPPSLHGVLRCRGNCAR